MSQPVEAIDRTPEYNQFMRQLRQFHERKGTTLQPEPVLGGKKLDLLKIYKTVMAAGGYEKVTANRGWKQVGDPFDFPPTCTNSAYILKAVYTKNLLGWEEETHWKRPWDPPRDDPPTTRGHGRHSSPLPPPTANKPRDAARSTATAFLPQPGANGKQHYPLQPPYQAMPTAPYFHPALPPEEEFRMRTLCALKCGLPNEEDWAFNTLIRISFSFENFNLEFMPSLLDILLSFAKPYFDTHIKRIHQDGQILGDPFFSSEKQQEQLERVLQVFHIIRNFSFHEGNIRRLVHHPLLYTMLMVGVRLPFDSPYAELGRHCLDILENIAPQISVKTRQDPYLETMFKLLFTNDRALILGAIRALTRVAVTETNEPVMSTGNEAILERMSQFLLVDDEELAAATLEYLYQCSSLRGNFSDKLVEHYPGNIVGLLTGYLSYKSALVTKPSSLNETIHGIPASLLANSSKAKSQAPLIPDLTDYVHLDEPYRCLGWLKEKLLTAGLEDKIALKEVYSKYTSLFGDEKPLQPKEFFTVLKIAFPQPASVEAMLASGSTPVDDIVLQNVRYAPSKDDDRTKCYWRECEKHFDTEAALQGHIVQEHTTVTDGKPLECGWMNCKRKADSKQAAVRHLRTHFSNVKFKRPRKRSDFSIDKIPVDESDVSGVPLTAALLLRNLGRNKNNHDLFMPYCDELLLLSIQRPKLARYVLGVLAELRSL